VLVALIAGMAVSLAVFLGLRHWEWQRIRIGLESAVHDRCAAIEEDVEQHRLVLESVRSFCSVSEDLDRRQFQEFVAPFLSRLPAVQALVWTPRVPDAERAECEAAARKDGLAGFRITEKDPQGAATPAARRPDCFPVYYVEPRRGNEAAVGYDLASNPTRLEALRRAMDSGQPAATARITLLEEKETRFGFLIFLPLYAKGMPGETVAERRQALRGFVVGVFRLAGMVETALSRLRPGGIDIRLDDLSAPAGERLLYFHPSRVRRKSSPPPAGGEIESLNDTCRASRYSVGGRTWQLLCTPAPGYLAAHRTWQPWAALTGGLAFTAMLAWYYFAGVRRAARAQHALRASELRYRSLFHGSPISLREEDYSDVRRHLDRLRWAGVADFREYFAEHPEAVRACAAKVKVLDLNQAALHLYGAASKQELLAGLAAIFTDETYDTFREGLIAMADGKTVFDIETPVRTLQGAKRQILLRWAAAPGSERTLATVYISQTDITQRKRAEEALQESESRFRSVIDTSPGALALLDMDCRILVAGTRAARLLGYDNVAEFLSNVRSGFDVLAPEEHQRAADNIRGLVETGLTRNDEYWMCRRDGSRFAAEISTSLQRDSSGAATAMIVVLRDITQRRQAEELLQHAKETAEAANRAKSEFLANMSHEIRTPMTAILGFSDLLMTPDLPREEHDEFLNAIRRNGKALLELINGILDLSKIEADRMTVGKEDCSPLQIINEAIMAVRVRAEQKGLPVELDCRFPLPERICTDPARLRQILVNLLGNAVKFTERGAVRATVCCLRNENGAAQMQFAVSDTGIGIHPEKIRELFQPFMQADASATRRYGGTGLGLAISKRLAKALNGEIGVASELGKGSTFTLTIDVGPLEGVPMLQAPQVAPIAAEEPAPKEQEPALHGRVLLVEDAPGIQLVVRQMFRKMNLEVEVADNGQMACRLTEKSRTAGSPYDLILMDMQMPEMNGYEATRWLRQHGEEMPIVALTAHAMVGDREKCLEAGCNDYLAKPITAAALRDMLARYLGQAATLAT
jgi:PAS domain S-box-containing protein